MGFKNLGIPLLDTSKSMVKKETQSASTDYQVIIGIMVVIINNYL